MFIIHIFVFFITIKQDFFQIFKQIFTTAVSVFFCLLACRCTSELMTWKHINAESTDFGLTTGLGRAGWFPRARLIWGHPTHTYILYAHWCPILNAYVHKHPHMFDVKEVLGGIHENKFPLYLTFQFPHTLCLTLSGIMQPLGLLEVAAQSSSVLLAQTAAYVPRLPIIQPGKYFIFLLWCVCFTKKREVCHLLQALKGDFCSCPWARWPPVISSDWLQPPSYRTIRGPEVPLWAKRVSPRMLLGLTVLLLVWAHYYCWYHYKRLCWSGKIWCGKYLRAYKSCFYKRHKQVNYLYNISVSFRLKFKREKMAWGKTLGKHASAYCRQKKWRFWLQESYFANTPALFEC